MDFPTGPMVPGLDITGTATGIRYRVEGERDRYRLTVIEVGGDGRIEVAVPEGLAADLFGNINYASTGEDGWVDYDGTRPVCVIHSDRAGVVNNDTMEITLSFSEPVFGLDDSVLSVLENARVVRTAGADGDTDYTFAVTPLRDGILAIRVPEDAVRDAVGNGNPASQVYSLIVDSTPPTVQLTSFETPETSNARFIRVRATFSEPVTGFTREDIALTSGRLVTFTSREGGREYTFDVRPDRGPVTLHIPAGVAADSIGNPNLASEVFHRDFGVRERRLAPPAPRTAPPRADYEPGVGAPPLNPR